MLDQTDDRHGDPIQYRRAKRIVLYEDRPHGIGEHVKDVALFETADQREQRDVKEDRAPVELLQGMLEARRLDAVTEQRKHQHQGNRA